MAIKIVVNGYFRSGTTLFWDMIKQAYSTNNCFYEPLHPLLPRYVKNIKAQTVNELHNVALWDEYSNLKHYDLHKILVTHPNLYHNRFNLNELLQYFNVFNEFSTNCILQTNRAHFFLEDIFHAYDSKIIHIIRNPYAVYQSILKAYFSESKGFKRTLKNILPLQWFNVFEIKDEFNWIIKHYGKPTLYFENVKERISIQNNIFKMFCVVYCVNNYVAINAAQKCGKIISYDKIINDPETELKELSKYLQIDKNTFKHKTIRRREIKDITQEEKKFNEKFNSYVSKFDLMSEYNSIQKHL